MSSPKLLLVWFFVSLIWSAVACWLAFSGWWMAAVATPGHQQGFYQWAAHEVSASTNGTAALVLIDKGSIEYELFEGGVDAETLFPTASLSKWITGFAVMSLVEIGELDLDEPINSYLSRWRLPESSFDNSQVTARRLLSHTSGLTDRLGFGDYRGDERLPSIVEALKNPRASDGSSRAITLGLEPGSEFLYSGGGYLLLQLLIEEVTESRFENYVAQSVFSPVGMERSTYAYLGDERNATPSFDIDGAIAPTYHYASAAATGLASTSTDLAKLVQTLIDANGTPVLADTAKTMRQPHGRLLGADIWGLGTMLYAPTDNGDFVYGHDGANEPAINASVRINPESKDAMVMLVSGNPALASRIGAEWVLWQTGIPDFLSTDRVLHSAVMPSILGSGLTFFLLFIAKVAGARRERN